MRTFLCILSIVIGVASIVLMVSMGRGAQKKVLDMIRGMGTNLIVVNAGHVSLVGGRERQAAIVTTLRLEDADAIKELVHSVTNVAPEVSHKKTLQWESENLKTNIIGVTPVAFDIRHIEIESGKPFDWVENDTASRVAVIGSVIVEKVFRNKNPVGQWIRIGRAPFKVVGVMKAKGVDASGVDRDDRVLIPIRTAMLRLVRTTYINKIHIQVSRQELLAKVESQIRELLRKRHRLRDKPDDFTIQNQATLLQT